MAKQVKNAEQRYAEYRGLRGAHEPVLAAFNALVQNMEAYDADLDLTEKDDYDALVALRRELEGYAIKLQARRTKAWLAVQAVK